MPLWTNSFVHSASVLLVHSVAVPFVHSVAVLLVHSASVRQWPSRWLHSGILAQLLQSYSTHTRSYETSRANGCVFVQCKAVNY